MATKVHQSGVSKLSLHQFYEGGIKRTIDRPLERYCQAMFNHLQEVRPDLAKQVQAIEGVDPFYADKDSSCWNAFVWFIETHWYLPINTKPEDF